MAVGKGDAAPDFTLSGMQDGERRTTPGGLPREAGRARLLSRGQHTRVHPSAEHVHRRRRRVRRPRCAAARHQPSRSTRTCGFADKQGGFAFPLLADEDKAVGKAYGILGPVGFYRRSVFVIDGSGTITYVHRAFAGATFGPTDTLVKAARDAS